MRLLHGRRALILAMIFGLTAAFASYKYVEQRAAAPQKVATATVLVAAQDIPTRTRLTGAMLKQIEIPASAKHPDAVSSLKDAEGKVTRLPLTAGEQILFKKFNVERAESGLSFVIPPSKRAVSINVNEVIGSGGLILPGDHVDVLAVFDSKTMGKDMATLILQDIEVLAVGQTLEVDEQEPNVAQQAGGAIGLGAKKASAAEQTLNKPKTDAKAKSLTVSVDIEQAQRLVLAEARGKLRVALRPYKDSTVMDLPGATLSNIQAPVRQGKAQITGVSISPSQLNAGDTMKVEITVKNVSTDYIRSQGPDPGFTYIQGQTYYSQNYASKAGSLRVGLNFAGQSAVEFPYRWGLGADLPPGASVTVVGYVKFATDFKPTNFWAGLIMEPAEVVQDNVGSTTVSVSQVNTISVTVDMAQIRSGPSISAGVVEEVPFGTQLTVISQQDDWYRVRAPDSGREGYIPAGWTATPR